MPVKGMAHPMTTIFRDLKGASLMAMLPAPLLTRLKLRLVAAEPFTHIWPAPISVRDSSAPTEDTLHLPAEPE